MKIKFKTFNPYRTHCDPIRSYTAAEALNKWLEENPNVEVLSWQACPVGTTNELYITIQYREREEE